MLTAPLLLELAPSPGTADPGSLAAWPPAKCSHVADTSAPMRRQMLVRMNAVTAAGGARLLT
jgi:hypothetical protein